MEGSVLVWNQTEGLCGTLDGNPENDMMTKEGVVAKTKSVLFDSWKLRDFGGDRTLFDQAFIFNN